MLKYVKVPAFLEALFVKAERSVEDYFRNFKHRPQQGTLEIGGERYILLRTESMSVHFFQYIKNMYPGLDEQTATDASSKVLFDMAKSFGISDAINFHKVANLRGPLDKISTGPVVFSHTGWANVELSPDCVTVADDSFYLLYDHPRSFEAEAWMATGQQVDFCTCIMSAGYSSGWVQQSYSMTLVAQEILCRAKGDKYCRFIMARPHRLAEFIQDYKHKNPQLFSKLRPDE